MRDTLITGSLIAFTFFAVYNLIVLTLLAMSFGEMSWLVRGRQPGRRALPPSRPGISVLVPAFDEELLVVATVASLLAVDYEPLEIVVVDDGSTDATFDRLAEAFDLVPVPLGGPLPIPTAEIQALYASRVAPGLLVVRKANGGRADALNAALGVARQELVAVVDADGLLEPDALASALRPFEEDPDDCVASGGTIRVLGASRVGPGGAVEARVGRRGLAATQVIEYLRGFLGTRIAWSRMNGLLVVSGAFGVFRRDMLLAVGGFMPGSLGEDMELTIRLHHSLRPDWPGARVAFCPDAVCWTQAPDTLGGLRSQRMRWQVGLLETIRLHRGMFGRRRYGAAGTLAFPFVSIFDALAPFFQIVGYAVTIALVLLYPSTWPYLVLLVVGTVLFGLAQSIAALLVEELGFRRYGRLGVAKLLGWSLLECVWFQPLIALWKFDATVRFVFGRRPSWGTIPRRTLEEAPADSAVPLTR